MAYQGKNRTKSSMRCYVYWPNIDWDIANMLKSCKGRETIAKTDHPWQRIHVDFAGPVDNMYYLIVVNSHWKWPEV